MRLHSKIDDVITEDIVENIVQEADLTFADDKHIEAFIEKPVDLDKTLLDLFCGVTILASDPRSEVR